MMGLFVLNSNLFCVAIGLKLFAGSHNLVISILSRILLFVREVKIYFLHFRAASR